MASVVTIECHGVVPDGCVPFVCGPFPGLGDGQPQHGPTLIRVAPNVWRVQVALPGASASVACGSWLTGLRSLELEALRQGAGFLAAPPHLRWHYQIAPEPTRFVELVYYSGWPQVWLQLHNGRVVTELPLHAEGAGRAPGETLWSARIDTAGLASDWGFMLSGPASQYDRPPRGALYRPRGGRVFLADGELFDAPPPLRRSAPRRETIRFQAPEMGHTFVIHVVLPRDYDVRAELLYPLVLLHDGQNQLTNQGMLGGWHTDTIADRLMRGGRMRDAVLAAVEMHTDRNRALFPPGDAKAPQGQGPLFADLLAGPICELLRSRFRLLKGPADTALIGSSNGAIHAISTGLQRPDAIGLIGSLSYARMSPERNLAQLAALDRAPFQRVYLDSGTRWSEDDENDTRDDHTLVTYQLRDALLARGMVLEHNLRYRLAYSDAHNERAWRRRIGDCLAFLLPPV